MQAASIPFSPEAATSVAFTKQTPVPEFSAKAACSEVQAAALAMLSQVPPAMWSLRGLTLQLAGESTQGFDTTVG